MMAEKASKKLLTIPEAHQILQKIDIAKADQIQKRTLDYTAKFAKVTPESAKKLCKELETDCGLSEEEAVEVVNVMPKSIEELDLHLRMEEAPPERDPRESSQDTQVVSAQALNSKQRQKAVR